MAKQTAEVTLLDRRALAVEDEVRKLKLRESELLDRVKGSEDMIAKLNADIHTLKTTLEPLMRLTLALTGPVK